MLAGLTTKLDISDTHREALNDGHAVDALVAAYTGWLGPAGLEPPPPDYNQAAGWIWLPRLAAAS